MNNLSLANRLKARLTRSDRLTDATALLQRMLTNRTASEAPFTSGTSADALGRGASKAFGAGAPKEALDWTTGTAQPGLPEALRDTRSGRWTRIEDSWVVEQRVGWCAMRRGGEP